MWNIPNILSLARLVLLIPIIGLFYLEPELGASVMWPCLALYVIASITDFLDGYLARKSGQVTAFGTFIDPISDKVFVGAMLVLLVGFGRLPGLWMLAVIIILSREFLVSGLREFLGPKNIKLPVTSLAKWKTAVQMIATGFLVIGPYVPYATFIGQWGLAAAAMLTVMTGWIYIRASWNVISQG